MANIPNAIVVAERLDEVEDLLAAGLNPGTIQTRLAAKYSVDRRSVRRWIEKVYARWRETSVADAPHRREKLYRQAERWFAKLSAKCGGEDYVTVDSGRRGEKRAVVIQKPYSAATQTLAILGRMSGAFAQHDPKRDDLLADLGDRPTDPTQALIYAQRCMLIALEEVVTNLAIDPEKRIRWIADIGAKIGMTHAKALQEAKLDEVAQRVLPAPETHADELEDMVGVALPATSRFGPRYQGGGPRSGPGAVPPAPGDEGSDPGGGGNVGPH